MMLPWEVLKSLHRGGVYQGRSIHLLCTSLLYASHVVQQGSGLTCSCCSYCVSLISTIFLIAALLYV